MSGKNGGLRFKGRALVAEDNEINAELITMLLNRYGISADIAANGLEAVKMMRAEKGYNIAFMDVNMPVMDGVEATKLARKSGVSIPIIALTGEADTKSLIKSGMDGAIMKPVDKNKLETELEKYLIFMENGEKT